MLEKIMGEEYEAGMRNNFTLIYEQYARFPERLTDARYLDKSVTSFYAILCSFSKSNAINNYFKEFRKVVVPELFYKQTFWHVKEGYIEEYNSYLQNCLKDVDDLTTRFISVLLKFKNFKNLTDEEFDKILESAIEEFEEILKNYDNPKELLTAHQFAEIVMIKSLTRKLKAVLNKTYILIETPLKP